MSQETIDLSPPPSRRSLGLPAFLGGAILAGLFFAGALPRWRAQAALRADTEELSVPRVTLISPAPTRREVGITLPAEIRPWQEASIIPRVTGYLKRWHVDIGTKVEAGQLLAEIDTPELDQELGRARALSAEADSRLELARSSAARWKELVKNATVSQQETEEKVNAVATGTSALEAARAEVRRLEELQSFRRLVAPFEGVVTVRRIDVGDMVSASAQKELFHLVQSKDLRVFVRVPQPSTSIVTNGQVATLTVPGLAGRAFRAQVVRMAGALESSSRTLLTELKVENSSGEILPGSYGQVRFESRGSGEHLSLPANAFLFRAEGPQVGVVDAQGKVSLRSVQLGRDFGTTIEIAGGVSAGDRVILNPSDSLVDGSQVRVAEPTPSGKAAP